MCASAHVVMQTTTFTQTCMSMCTHICSQICVCSPSLPHIHTLISHVTVTDMSSSYNEPFPAWASVHTETRQIACLSKMHEKRPQKSHMLSEVSDQWPANSIKFPSHTHPAPTQTSPQRGKG